MRLLLDEDVPRQLKQTLTALTRAVSPRISECALTYVEREPIDYERAHEQHNAYEALLRGLGVEVISLPTEPDMPDSSFIEDTAVVVVDQAPAGGSGVPRRHCGPLRAAKGGGRPHLLQHPV